MAKGSSRARPSRHGNGKGKRTPVEYLYGEGPARAAQIRIGRTASRVGKHAARLKSYGLPDPSIVDDLQEAHKRLRSAEAKLARVPKGWRPVRGTLGATPIEEDSRVVVRDAFTARYEGVFDTSKPLTVRQILGARVVCETTYRGAKIRIPMPRSHVQSA